MISTKKYEIDSIENAMCLKKCAFSMTQMGREAHIHGINILTFAYAVRCLCGNGAHANSINAFTFQTFCCCCSINENEFCDTSFC